MQAELLGETLCDGGALPPAALARALALQKKTGSRLGDILIGEGFLGYRALYEAVARRHALPFVDLLAMPPDPLLLNAEDAETYLRLGVMPWHKNGDTVRIAVTSLSEPVVEWVEKKFGDSVEFLITSPFDIRRTVENCFGAGMEMKSRLLLWDKNPLASARFTLAARQRKIVIIIAAAAIGVTLWMPVYSLLAFIIFCHAIYAATMLFKYIVFAVSPTHARAQHPPRIDDASLPVYTVLIPMYREAASLPGMLAAMHAMDYPASKLDIKLVLEADDRETLAAAYALKPGYHFDIIRVPPGQLRTKPKACNYALKFARGEYVTVFDADDRPDPQQLKKAVQAFRESPPNVACLQARLNYYNANDNLLTRFFSLEYTLLFHFTLYGLERLGIPIPLGGTSNHIALARIKELGEWDPYNVTEDADLGIRLAAAGLQTRMLDSDTMEEAPNRARPWINQRSRWIKGYMQTWLVHMRRPGQLYRTLGVKGFIGFQFFMGLSCFSFVTAPLVWAFSLLWIGNITAWHGIDVPIGLIWLGGINLALNLITHWYLSVYCASLYQKNKLPMLIAGVLYPFYLVLHSLASYKALWQLTFRPHFWEKTTHGLAKMSLTAPPAAGRKAPHLKEVL